MARKNVTSVAQSKFVATAQKLGMTVKTNKGEIKVWPAEGSIKRSLGIPNTKGVTRIQLIGFESAEFGVVHPKPPAATVTQMLDFAQDEKLILRAFFKVAKQLVEDAKLAATPVAQPEATTVEATVEQVAELEVAAG